MYPIQFPNEGIYITYIIKHAYTCIISFYIYNHVEKNCKMVGWGEGGLEKVPTLMSDKGDFHFIHQILCNALQLTLWVHEK